MISRTALVAVKVLVGVSLAGIFSVGYAAVFSYTHPVFVFGGMGICFLLLTLPMWLSLAGKPLRNVPAYALLVLLVLVGLTLGRFPIETLFRQ